jgi:hypothetical protein
VREHGYDFDLCEVLPSPRLLVADASGARPTLRHTAPRQSHRLAAQMTAGQTMTSAFGVLRPPVMLLPLLLAFGGRSMKTPRASLSKVALRDTVNKNLSWPWDHAAGAGADYPPTLALTPCCEVA